MLLLATNYLLGTGQAKEDLQMMGDCAPRPYPCGPFGGLGWDWVLKTTYIHQFPPQTPKWPTGAVEE